MLPSSFFPINLDIFPEPDLNSTTLSSNGCNGCNIFFPNIVDELQNSSLPGGIQPSSFYSPHDIYCVDRENTQSCISINLDIFPEPDFISSKLLNNGCNGTLPNIVDELRNSSSPGGIQSQLSNFLPGPDIFCENSKPEPDCIYTKLSSNECNETLPNIADELQNSSSPGGIQVQSPKGLMLLQNPEINLTHRSLFVSSIISNEGLPLEPISSSIWDNRFI